MARVLDTDLTTGPIGAKFRALAIPGAIGMLFNTLYNVVDMYFAGMLSTSAQAGLALGFQTFFIAMSAGIGLAAAMGSIVGNAVGAKDRPKARRLAAQGLAYALIAALVLIVAGAWYGPRIIAIVSEPGDYRDAGIRYYLWLSFAMPGFLLMFAGNGILQAHGDSRSMQRALIAAFFANVALNPLCIYGIPGVWGGWGFDGLAISTVLSQTGVMVYMLRQVMRLETMSHLSRHDLRPRLAVFREISLQSLPASFAFLIMILSAIVVQYALKGFGEQAIAGFAIAIRFEQILLLPVMGVTGALLPIAAQNFGAGNFERVREAFFFCLKVGLVITVLAFPVLWIFGRTILGLFTDDAEVIRIGLGYLRVESFILPVYMLLFSINAFLQALKRPIWTLWIGMYRQAFGVAFFVWVFVGWFGFDELGVWLGIATSVVTGAIIAVAVAAGIAGRELGGFWRPIQPVPT
jgi:putative MATE family efflux protein